MNNVVLMGRLVRDPEVRYSNTSDSNPLAIARYTLAVDRGYKNKGSDGQTADFISIVSFGKAGEFAEKYLRKGIKVVVTGRIQTGSYTDREGRKIYTTEVVTSDIEFAESKRVSDQNNAGNYSSAPSQAPVQSSYDGFMNIPDGFDEELPFD